MSEMQPLDIIGVVQEEVGSPHDLFTRGGGLYAVPVKLSRKLDFIEKRLLPQIWDNPPSFTTMHREGILEVRGDTVLLNGTTIDEVAQYHAKTLRLVVEKVNVLAAEERITNTEAEQRRSRERDAHREHVADIADSIDFCGGE